jgi:hypothetical protein
MKPYLTTLLLLAATCAAQAADREVVNTTQTVVKERTVNKVVPAGSKIPAKTVLNRSAKELAIPKGAKVARLSVGETKLIYTAKKRLFSSAKSAFYLPPEATAVAQLVVETKGSEINYFLKGRGPGVTIGGEVPREWLDASGFRPRNEADAARIQQQLKAAPLYIDVR